MYIHTCVLNSRLPQVRCQVPLVRNINYFASPYTATLLLAVYTGRLLFARIWYLLVHCCMYIRSRLLILPYCTPTVLLHSLAAPRPWKLGEIDCKPATVGYNMSSHVKRGMGSPLQSPPSRDQTPLTHCSGMRVKPPPLHLYRCTSCQ